MNCHNMGTCTETGSMLLVHVLAVTNEMQVAQWKDNDAMVTCIVIGSVHLFYKSCGAVLILKDWLLGSVANLTHNTSAYVVCWYRPLAWCLIPLVCSDCKCTHDCTRMYIRAYNHCGIPCDLITERSAVWYLDQNAWLSVWGKSHSDSQSCMKHIKSDYFSIDDFSISANQTANVNPDWWMMVSICMERTSFSNDADQYRC